MSVKIFVSVFGADEHAAKLCERLSAAGAQLFVCDSQCRARQNPDDGSRIDEALQTADVFLLAGSASGLGVLESSRGVKYEWSKYMNELTSGRKSGALYIVLDTTADDSELPFGLRGEKMFTFDRQEELVELIAPAAAAAAAEEKEPEDNAGAEGEAVQDDVCPTDDFEFREENGGLVLVRWKGSGACAAVPESVDGKPVVAIGKEAFANLDGLKTVVLSGVIESIDSAAFMGCADLKEINVAESNSRYTSVGGVLFSKAGSVLVRCPCGREGKYDIPSGVRRICSEAFLDCRRLQSVSIPEGVSSIGERAFSFCRALTAVNIPGSVKTLEKETFFSCDSLTAVRLNEGTEKICADVFFRCVQLKNINLPFSLKEISCVAFWDCASLGRVEIFANTEISGGRSFKNCNAEIVQTGGRQPRTRPSAAIREAGEEKAAAKKSRRAGSGAARTAEVASDVLSRMFRKEEFRFRKRKDGYALVGYLGSERSVRVPGERNGVPVKTIEMNAFCRCPGLRSVVFSEGVVCLNDGAFFRCSDLEEVIIPKSVTEILPETFFLCEKLTAIKVVQGNPVYMDIDGVLFSDGGKRLVRVPEGKTGSYTVPDGVTEIDKEAFLGCGITSVSIPASVTKIGAAATLFCKKLTAIKVAPGNPVYMDIDGVLFTDGGKRLVRVPEGKTGSYTVPEGVTEICEMAFRGCEGITSVTVPDSTEKIGEFAFYDCHSLKLVRLPHGMAGMATSRVFPLLDGLKILVRGDKAQKSSEKKQAESHPDFKFEKTDLGLTVTGYLGKGGDVIVPARHGGVLVVQLGERVFAGRSDIETISLPSTLTGITTDAFNDCEKLKEIRVSEDNTVFASVDGVLLSKNGERLIACPGGLEGYYVIPDGVTCIVNRAFCGCRKLNTIRLPKSVTDIESLAFANCTALVGITIPAGVKKIGNQVFRSCESLEAINVDIGNRNFKSVDGVLLSRDGSCLLAAPGKLSGSYKVPQSVTYIGSFAFEQCVGLESVILPDGLVDIGSGAFLGCTGLDSVRIPDGTRSIGDWVFWGCTGLEAVDIPDSLVSAGKDVFKGCKALKKVYIPAGLEGIVAGLAESCPEGCALIEKEPSPDGTEDFFFEPVDDGFSVTGYSGGGGEVNIPAVYDGRPVTEIGASAFSSRGNITGVVIPGSVRRIGDSAFEECLDLVSVTVSDGVACIGADAFRGCTRLESVVIPDSVTEIQCGAFESCAALASVTLSKNAALIEAYAFADCISLVSVAIPEGVTVIGESAFAGCTALVSAFIPNSLTDIEAQAFAGCVCLDSVTIPNSSVRLGNRVFDGCTSLVDIYAPNGLKKLTGKEMDGCNARIVRNRDKESTEEKRFIFRMSTDGYVVDRYDGHKGVVRIPASYNGKPVTAIESYAFQQCTGITEVFLPDSVTAINQRAFAGCTGLSSVRLSENLKIIGNHAFRDCTALESVTVPESVKIIGESAFEGCTRLSSLNLSHGLDVIGESAFRDCISLEEATVPGSVSSIGSRAFMRCRRLASVTITDGIGAIGDGAFMECTGLASVVVPSSVKVLGEFVFAGCSSLRNVLIPASLRLPGNTFTGYQDNVLVKRTLTLEPEEPAFVQNDPPVPAEKFVFKEAGCGYVLEKYCGEGGEVTVPAWFNNRPVLEIGVYSFANRDDITSVTIPENVEVIGRWAFEENTGLTMVSLPESLREIGGWAFNGCVRLAGVTIPEGVETIYTSAFKNCMLLASVTIPDSVKKIGSEVFSGCTNLKRISVPSGLQIKGGTMSGCSATVTVRQDKAVPQPAAEETTIISDGDCTFLRTGDGYVLAAYTGKGGEVTVPASCNGMPVIGIGGEAFAGCEEITSVVIPENVVSIGWSAFRDCGKLASVVLPESLEKIEDGAFWNCTGLGKIELPAGICTLGNGVFLGCEALTEINTAPGSTYYTSQDGVLFTGDGKTLVAAPPGIKGEYTVPSDVLCVGSHAFAGCEKLVSVTIGGSVDRIGDDAFFGCTGLRVALVYHSVTEIGHRAFARCSMLTVAALADSVKKIGQHAFAECSSLAVIELPKGLEELEWGVFENCTALKRIAIPHMVRRIDSHAFSGCELMVHAPHECRHYGFEPCDGIGWIII